MNADSKLRGGEFLCAARLMPMSWPYCAATFVHLNRLFANCVRLTILHRQLWMTTVEASFQHRTVRKFVRIFCSATSASPR